MKAFGETFSGMLYHAAMISVGQRYAGLDFEEHEGVSTKGETFSSAPEDSAGEERRRRFAGGAGALSSSRDLFPRSRVRAIGHSTVSK